MTYKFKLTNFVIILCFYKWLIKLAESDMAFFVTNFLYYFSIDSDKQNLFKSWHKF